MENIDNELLKIVNYVNSDKIIFNEPYIKKKHDKIGSFYLIATINNKVSDAYHLAHNIIRTISKNMQISKQCGFFIVDIKNGFNMYVADIDLVNKLGSAIRSNIKCDKCNCKDNHVVVKENGEIILECKNCNSVLLSIK